MIICYEETFILFFLKILIFVQIIENKGDFGRVIANVYKKLYLSWKNEKKILNLSTITPNNYKILI
ncbi:hypothetical protein OA848_03025 [Rickettsiales bacterium]|nr:hypothetical protein [Rickettsiales bacterium]